MLLLWGLREFPRLTVLFTFFVYHQEVFVPLLHYTSETEIEESLYEVRKRIVNKFQYGLLVIFSPKKAHQSSIGILYINYSKASVSIAVPNLSHLYYSQI